jgi:O-antigen ligase
MITGVAAIAALALVVGAIFLPTRWLQRISAILNIAQGYAVAIVPSLGAQSLRLSGGWAIAIIPAVLLKCWRQLTSPYVLLTVALVVSQVVSIAWSPDKSVWLLRVMQGGVVVVALLVSFESRARGRSPLRDVLAVSSPLALLQAASVAVFLISPSMENRYLHSRIAKFFLGLAAPELFTPAGFNNVLDSSKSGGLLFTNANVASLFLGMFAMGYAWLWLARKSTGALAMALVCIVATPLTGSKTGMILGTVLSALVALCALIPRRRGFLLFGSAAGAIVVLAVVGLVSLVTLNHSRLVQQIPTSLDSRFGLWREAGELFLRRPITGLGFGGWVPFSQRLVAEHVEDKPYPPHNFLIANWGESGLLTLLIVLALLITVVWGGVRSLRASRTLRTAMANAALLAVAVWPMLHGQADNTQFYGTELTASLFSAALAQISPHVAKPSGDQGWLLRITRSRVWLREDPPSAPVPKEAAHTA